MVELGTSALAGGSVLAGARRGNKDKEDGKSSVGKQTLKGAAIGAGGTAATVSGLLASIEGAKSIKSNAREIGKMTAGGGAIGGLATALGYGAAHILSKKKERKEIEKTAGLEDIGRTIRVVGKKKVSDARKQYKKIKIKVKEGLTKANPMNGVRDSIKKTMGSAADDVVENMGKVRGAATENLEKATEAAQKATSKMGTTGAAQAAKLGLGAGVGLAGVVGIPYAAYKGVGNHYDEKNSPDKKLLVNKSRNDTV